MIAKFDRKLGIFIQDHGLGELVLSPMDLQLGERDVYQPDLAFISKENVAKLDPKKRLTVIPDLVIEILSPLNGLL